jgi:hypothetical protein
MAQAQRKFDVGFNYYVPGMQAGAELGQALTSRILLGSPKVAAAAAILNDQSIATAGDVTTFLIDQTDPEAMGLYGRAVQVVASGAATSTVTVIGRDYLGQPMRETLTLNGANAVLGLKAFKYIDKVSFGATAATTIDLGTRDALGLPYVVVKVDAEIKDNVSGTVGTLTAPIFTDPQTATTGDPRGLYDPNGTLDGVAVFEIIAELSNFVNSSGRGGLYGIQHVNA